MFADLALGLNEMLPSVAQLSMSSAQLLLPVVGLVGGSDAASMASGLVTQALRNGKVYSVIPLFINATTEPVVYVSVNGGWPVPVLVDTGSAGLVIASKYVPDYEHLTYVGSGSSGYSGGLSYHYDTYDTTVNFWAGVVTDPTDVDIVSGADQAAFLDFLAPAGVVGVLGVGPNASGPNDTVPLTALPGELNSGVLIDEPLHLLVLAPPPAGSGHSSRCSDYRRPGEDR